MAMPAPRVAFTAEPSPQDACKTDDVHAVALVLKAAAADGSLEHVLLPTSGSDGLTPLGWAASNGLHDIAQLLLAYMPERQVLHNCALGHIPLIIAAMNGHTDLCPLLLRFAPEQQLVRATEQLPGPGCPCCSDSTALMCAAGHGDTEVVKVLLTHIPDRQVLHQNRKGISALHVATRCNSAGSVATLLQHAATQQVHLQDERGRTALHFAAYHGYADIVQQLLAAHDPVQQVLCTDEDGCMPVHIATTQGHTDAVRCLLMYRPQLQLVHYSGAGVSSLLYAADKANVALMRVLLSCAHNPEQLVRQRGSIRLTPLMVAANRCSAAAVQLLLQYSPDWQVQQVSEGRCTPLMYAVNADEQSGSLEVARLLLRHSPEVQVQQVSHHGMSALAFAMRRNRLDITQELLKHCPAKQLTAGRSIEDSLLCVAVAMAKVDFVQEVASRVTDPAVLALGLMGATAVTSPSSNAAASAAFAKAQLRCCHLLLAAGADPTSLTPQQLSAFDRAQPEVQKLVQEACRRRRKGQRPAQDEQSKAQAEEAEARAEQAAAALLAEEEADRAKAQAVQAKKDKKKQKKAAAKAQKADARADTAGQEDMTGVVEVEEGEVAAETHLSAAGPSEGSGSGGSRGSGASGNGGGDSSRGGGSDDVGSSRSASNSKGGSTSVGGETVKGPDTCTLPVTPGAQPSSSYEDDRWCVVCLERHSCRALVPCGHIVMCGPCCEAVQASKNECPMCREGILAVLAINTANL